MKFVKSGTTLSARTSPNKFTSSLSKKGTYHIECQNISEQVYQFLVKEGNSVHWFCDKCNGAAAKIYKMVCAVKVKQDEIETKVDFVTEKVELLENAMEAN